jgi:hypothetical protein
MNQQIVDEMIMLSLRESWGRFGGGGGGTPGVDCSAPLMMSVWCNPVFGNFGCDAEVTFFLLQLSGEGLGATVARSLREGKRPCLWRIVVMFAKGKKSETENRIRVSRTSLASALLKRWRVNFCRQRSAKSGVLLPSLPVKMRDGWGCNVLERARRLGKKLSSVPAPQHRQF